MSLQSSFRAIAAQAANIFRRRELSKVVNVFLNPSWSTTRLSLLVFVVALMGQCSDARAQTEVPTQGRTTNQTILTTLRVPPLQRASQNPHSLVGRRATPTNIPSPRPDGWLVDATNTLNQQEREYINEVCEEVFQTHGREMTVVVIDSTSGMHHRTFGMRLFNHRGVGGAIRNNGILLLAAIKDRKAEILLGKGIDTKEQERVAQQIMDDIVVPNFQLKDPGSALYEGIRSCAARIFLISDLKAPPELPGRAAKRVAHQKYRRRMSLIPWLLGGLGVGGLGLIFGARYWVRYRPRECESCDNARVLLNEVEDDEFLDPPEQIEERIGSVDYDVWACLECEQVLKLRYGKFWTRFSNCPKCRYTTRSKITRTLIQATTSRGGRVLVEESCAYCDYYNRHTYATPRIRKSSGGGSSFGGGGGGSGFGGGSSSGGGASGSW